MKIEIEKFTILAMAMALNCDLCPFRKECDAKYEDIATPLECVNIWLLGNNEKEIK